MSYLLQDKQYLYTFALCRSCRPDDAMTFGIAPSIERFLDRLCVQNNNAEVLKRIHADHTHNIGVSWLEARPALAQMIDQGQLSVIRKPRPRPKKKRWTREDWNPPPKENGPFDNTRYDSRGYPLYLDGWGDWRIDPAKPVKKGSDADGSRPLDPLPHEVWQKVANPDGTLKPEALRAGGPQPRKRVTVVYQYASGRPVAGALCSVYDQNNTLVGGGPIIAAPQTIFQLPNHVNRLTVELHDDPLIQAYLRRPFPNPEIPKAQPGWFDRMAAALSSAGDWAGGVVAGDFNEDPALSQIITNTAITLIPLVDQAADLRDIAAGLRQLLWVENGYQDYLVWAGLGLTVIGLFPTVGSLVKGVLKAVFFKLPLERLFKAFNSLAEGHAGRYLKQLQNGGLKELCSQSIKKTRQILEALYENLHRLKDRVPDFLLHIKEKINAILHALDECANRPNAMFSRFFDELAEKLNRAMGHKAELAFEGVPNSTVTYKQVKQEPPVFKVEDGAKTEYARGVDVVGPKKAKDTNKTHNAKDIPQTGHSITKPGGAKGGKPSGERAPEAGSQKQKHKRENESADTLADAGYKVDQGPHEKPNGKKPDYKIEDEYFDCLAPGTDNVNQVRKGISRKVNSNQADRIILNLDDTSLEPSDITEMLQRKPKEGLKEVIGIKKGKVTQIFP